MLARIRIRSEEEVAAMEAEQQRLAERMARQMQASGGGAPVGGALGMDAPGAQQAEVPAESTATGPKVGRNDPCPCGSGKKYKHCHGQLS
jgi:preprotein translocase subunit SecA